MAAPDSFDEPATVSQHRHRPQSPRRLWLLRGLSILCGLSFFVVVEVTCSVLDVGDELLDDDPFVGFNRLQPLFELDESSERFVIARSQRKYFVHDEFPAIKRAGTRRIFCLGGSTVQGRPFSRETSFTTWLQLALEQAQPELNWEVINCGGISYASYRLTPILQECLNDEPDAFILCTGHNEFLEDRSYSNVREVPSTLTVPFYSLSRFRSFRVFRHLLIGTSTLSESDDHRDVIGPEVDAFLDYRNGIEAYHRDDGWRQGVIAHFESNLERMVHLAQAANVPIILVRPPSNLADSPPFKSEHRSGMTPEELSAWQAAIQTARSSLKTFPAAAVESLKEALSIDDSFAETHFELGRLLELLGDFDAARQEFLLAREHDICPLRILAPMELAMTRVADRNHVPLLDAHRLLEEQTRHGILDGSMLVDHVHPSFAGHQSIAIALVEQLRQTSLVSPQGDWQPQARAAFDRHFEQLPDIYFAKGEQNLSNLRYWTQGMADGPPVESRPQQRAMSGNQQDP
ncbi:MAG: SGNH/GDSL hydrolase family protein [Rhodopirellula sp.]|nr:SGNH/GDSL hydrolase family protein [Rhodopirellula sp.]